MLLRLVVFLIINFAALGVGSLLMGKGASSEWYQNLYKAPWTPPGWTFGTAWTIIMVCFAFYMAYAWSNTKSTSFLLILFSVQWLLNVAWNPIFFRFHFPLFGLIIICILTILVGYMMFSYFPALKVKILFILPYFLWLLIATSLNGYIVLKN